MKPVAEGHRARPWQARVRILAGTVRSDSSEVKSGRAAKLITPVHLVPILKVERYRVQPEILLQRDRLHWPTEGQHEAKSAVISGCSKYSRVCCISSRAWFYPVASHSWTPRHVDLVCKVATIIHSCLLRTWQRAPCILTVETVCTT